MKNKSFYIISVLLTACIVIGFGAVLLMYAFPMPDVSMDLSLMPQEDGLVLDPDNFDSKGWTVYVADEETITELTPTGFGGYRGIELGQTFYYSRVMEEELDSPTLQIDTYERQYSVWLDDTLLYTDAPGLDNRIGYLTLPMSEWVREEPLVLSLPADYQGQTLTIAQSTPSFAETPTVMAFPASVRLYCGYAYESGLISESFTAAILASAVFLIGVALMAGFLYSRDAGLLFLALTAFLFMTLDLADTTFFYRYFGTVRNSVLYAVRPLAVLTMLIFLCLRSGRSGKILWFFTGLFGVSVLLEIAGLLIFPSFPAFFVINRIPAWIGTAALLTVLVLSIFLRRTEHRFWRIFCPLALAAEAVYFIFLIAQQGETFISQIKIGLTSVNAEYFFNHLLLPVTVVTLLTALADALKNVLDRRMEKRLLKERQAMELASYENMYRQHEEIMMLRHDMGRHFLALREMTEETDVKSYLNELIGQNEKIRPVIQSGNKMLDIILGSKLNAAADAGVQVEILRASSPAQLPVSDTDLCSLVMNILDNALSAARTSGAAKPVIRLDIHVKSGYFAFICENSAAAELLCADETGKTVPKHGFGMRIIRSIAERTGGLADTEYADGKCIVRVLIPLAGNNDVQSAI